MILKTHDGPMCPGIGGPDKKVVPEPGVDDRQLGCVGADVHVVAFGGTPDHGGSNRVNIIVSRNIRIFCQILHKMEARRN